MKHTHLLFLIFLLISVFCFSACQKTREEIIKKIEEDTKHISRNDEIKSFFQDFDCPATTQMVKSSAIRGYSELFRAKERPWLVVTDARVIQALSNLPLDPWGQPYKIDIMAYCRASLSDYALEDCYKDEDVPMWVSIYSQGPASCLNANMSEVERKFCKQVAETDSKIDYKCFEGTPKQKASRRASIQKRQQAEQQAKQQAEQQAERQRRQAERQRQYEKSPRGICERGCNTQVYQGSESWKSCMNMCQQLRSE